jgi:hypothetical protein
MKYYVYFAVGGAVIGAALAAWLAPGVIAWYFNPPVEMGGFSCNVPIAWALKRLQRAQLWGVIVGGVLGLVLYGVAHRRRSRQPAPPGSGPEGGGNEHVPTS